MFYIQNTSSTNVLTLKYQILVAQYETCSLNKTPCHVYAYEFILRVIHYLMRFLA